MSLESAATLLASSSYFKFIMLLHIVTSSAGILSMTLMEWNRRSRKLLAHRSLTLLMEMHSFWVILVCLTTLYNNTTVLHAHLTMRNMSDILISVTVCSYQRTLSTFAVYGSVFSQMAMAVERYLASRHLAAYESSGRRAGYLINAAHLAVTFIVCQMHLNLTDTGSSEPVLFCTIAPSIGGILFIVLASFVFSCELATIVTFVRLLLTNRRLRDNYDAGLSLPERYQLVENIRMIKMLLPVMWTHSSLGMIGTALFVILKLVFPSADMYPMIEVSINWLHLQGNCIPIVYLLRLRHERLHKQRVIDINSLQGVVLAVHHAEAITKGW